MIKLLTTLFWIILISASLLAGAGRYQLIQAEYGGESRAIAY